MQEDTKAGTARFVGEWIELSFPHDLRIIHALNGLGGRRRGMGIWRIPLARLDELARRLEPYSFVWEGDAAQAHQLALDSEQRFRSEDQRSAAIKAGTVTSLWESPVDLLPHQRVAVDFLAARTGALLCDEQGLGKTLSVLTAFWLLKQDNKASRLLVVCPNSLKRNWLSEIERFYPEWAVSIASGQQRQRRRAYGTNAHVYITNYEAARSDQSDLRILLLRAPTVLVCDESHAAKNASSRTTKALVFIRSAAARVWVLSGTPVPNKIEDAFAQAFLADGGRALGDKEAFWARYVRRADQEKAVLDLNHDLGQLLLRRTKDEVLDLPEKTFEERHVELRGEQRNLYNAFRGDLYDEVSGLSPAEYEVAKAHVLTRLLRLSQLASNPRLVVNDYRGTPVKFAEIDQILEELILGDGRKVVVWSYYVKTIEEFLARYRKYNPVAIYGAIEIEARASAVERFQEEPSVRLFIGNPQAAGTGLTLTAAHYAIYETLTWRYDLYAQSLDRIHRIGQDRAVTYFDILGADTIDVEVLERLKKKQSVAAELLGDEQRGLKLQQDEVLSLIAHPLR